MNELKIGNFYVNELVGKYGTPLYVYDESILEKNIDDFFMNFKSEKFKTKILYASKAFQNIQMINLVASKGLGLDVVSFGEIYTAIHSKIEKEMIYFHGNNKSLDEIQFAIKNGIVHFVTDNLDEIKVLDKITKETKVDLNIMIRLNVGIEAHTHEYICTSHIDSKFGVLFESDECKEILKIINESNYLTLEGFHSHIGSQIFDIIPWKKNIDKLLSYAKTIRKKLSINIGGGFGIKYIDTDTPISPDIISKELIHYTEKQLEKLNIEINELIIEPGRSIVGNAGITLYTIGFSKQTPHKKYCFIDGGISDNIRPALYRAEYRCDVATKLNLEKSEIVDVAGKLCESGDILIKNATIQPYATGDILAIYTTGAYGYSMASNYNKMLRPAVIFVNNDKIKVVVKRETIEDILKNEIF